jgi:putative nucleotidyltransferase with HDIG domain
MNSQIIIDYLIAQVGELPPMPLAARKALTLLKDPNSSLGEVAEILAMDEALTSLALRWANSAFSGLRYPVTTVHQAVTVVGQKVLHSLLLAASLATVLERPAPGYGLDRGELWRHSIGVAAGARLVAAHLGHNLSSEAYHAGLLADIGKLAFEVLLRDQNFNATHWSNRPFNVLEMEHFGVDHTVLGAEMARRWNFPAPLVDAIAWHHQPSQAKEGLLLASAVHIADAGMMALGVGIGYDGLQYGLDPAACKVMNWSEDKLLTLVEQVIPFIEEADQVIRLRRSI